MTSYFDLAPIIFNKNTRHAMPCHAMNEDTKKRVLFPKHNPSIPTLNLVGVNTMIIRNNTCHLSITRCSDK